MHDRRGRDQKEADHGVDREPAPGKRTLTGHLQRRVATPPPSGVVAPAAAVSSSEDTLAAALGFLGGPASSVEASLARDGAAVQRAATPGSDGGGGADAVHAAAAAGLEGPSSPLPHREQIQGAFGRHDLSHVEAHVAPAANAALGSEAYASGNQVAFADANPSLHTAAHEAAHVIQQRGGVQLRDGLGTAGDPYEQHAEAVAERVVRGESAEALLDPYAGGSATSAVQRRGPVQFWGDEHVSKFTPEAIDRWNVRYPAGKKAHIDASIKQRIVDCSDDPDKSGRAFKQLFAVGAVEAANASSDLLRIYIPFLLGTKKQVHERYRNATPEQKRNMEEAAARVPCASEGPEHGEGPGPNYANGGAAANQAWVRGQINAADTLTWGGFLSSAGAGQLGDAMHGAQDRGSHCEGQRNQGHDDLRDKLGIGDHNTDDPSLNTGGATVAARNSDQVLEDFKAVRERVSGQSFDGDA